METNSTWKRCGTCKYWKIIAFNKTIGTCLYKPSKLPASIKQPIESVKSIMFLHEGTLCVCYEPKPKMQHVAQRNATPRNSTGDDQLHNDNTKASKQPELSE